MLYLANWWEDNYVALIWEGNEVYKTLLTGADPA